MSLNLTNKLVLLGAGKMGGAMLEGWLAAGADPKKIVALDPAPPPEIAALLKKHGVAHNPPVESIGAVEVLLIAVKPQILDDAVTKVKPLVASHPLILSIAAGKTIPTFERHFGAGEAVIRCMPNTPAAVGQGITAMAGNANVSAAQWSLAEQLLSAVGEVVRVDHESQIDAVTGVSGSGPAYVFYFTECLAAAGVAAGLAPELAMKLARATVSGSGALMRQSGIDAATLRQNVTSPKGTTYAALQVWMAEDGLQPLATKAVAAATNRSRELAS